MRIFIGHLRFSSTGSSYVATGDLSTYTAGKSADQGNHSEILKGLNGRGQLAIGVVSPKYDYKAAHPNITGIF
jgi:hypothetical protein